MSQNLSLKINADSTINLSGVNLAEGTVEGVEILQENGGEVLKIDLVRILKSLFSLIFGTLILKIDTAWRAQITKANLESNTIDDIVVDREDGKFFKMVLTRALGYIFPMFFETLNKNEIAGNVCLLVRQNRHGQKYVVVENKNYVNFLGKKTSCVRACRSSISSPEGSPIPKGIKKDNIYHLNPIEINNMRLAGLVETYVVFQALDAPLADGQRLMSFEDFAKIDDCPGQAVLGQYLMLKEQMDIEEQEKNKQ